MKNKRIITIAVIALLTILLCVLTACGKPVSLEKGDFSEVLNRELPSIVSQNGIVKILQITDTHLWGNESKSDNKTLENIEKTIKADKYDLVVFSGDMLDGYNKESKFNKNNAIAKLGDMFARNNQYWSFVAGNNDGEYCGDNKDVFCALAKYEHCLVSDVGLLNGGVGNFNINIVDNENNLLHSLFMVDSRMRNDKGELLAISSSQQEWYLSKTSELKAMNVRSSMFMHIPALEFIDAYNKGEIVQSFENHLATTEINVNSASSQFYSAVLQSENNGLVATGHTHGSTYCTFYKNMYWLQLNSSAENQWKDKLLAGGAVIEIDTNKSNLKEMYSFAKINF